MAYLKEYVRMGMAGKEDEGMCCEKDYTEVVQTQWQQPPQWLPE